MKKRLLMRMVGAVLVLAGCSLAPDYQKPQAPIPAQWPGGDAHKETAASAEIPKAGDLNWQAFFTDEKLQQIIETALFHNRDLKLAALGVERVRALYDIQRAELYPSANATGAGVKQRRSVHLIEPGSSRTIEQYSIGIGIASWELDFFGRIRNLKDQALEQYLATEQAHRSARIALMAEVARAYLTLAADRENLALARATLQAQQDSYDLIQKSVRLGMATELDLRRVQTQVEAAKRDIPQYQQSVARGCNALNLLAGVSLPEALLSPDLNSMAPFKEISPGLPSGTMLKRPDIIAAEHRLKGAYATIGAARAAFFPRIALTTSLGTASSDLAGLFESGTGTWRFAPTIVSPIFDGRTWAAWRVSKTDREILLTRYEKTIQAAFREVADALAVLGAIDRQVAAQQALVDAAAEAFRLSEKRYELGIGDYLSVLDAHRALYAQQQVLVSLRLAKLANRVALYSVLGGGAE